MICYVVNAWQFSSPADRVGSEQVGLASLTRVQRPVDTAYIADNEHGSWRPIITELPTSGSPLLNDVWSPSHLPYNSGSRILNSERRVGAARHGAGSNLLFYDGHSQWRRATLLTVEDWREQKY